MVPLRYWSLALVLCALTLPGHVFAQAGESGVPGDGVPDIYYFAGDGLEVMTSAGLITRPAGTLTVDTDGTDMVTILVSGPNGLPTCDLCDGGFLPDPSNPPFFVSVWTAGFINGSSQWIRTGPLSGPGYVGVIGEDPDPNNLFPDLGLSNYGPGLSDADFPGIFDGTWSVLYATNDGSELLTNVTVLEPPATPVIGSNTNGVHFGACVPVGECDGATISIFNDVDDPTSILEITSLGFELPLNQPGSLGNASGGIFSLVNPPPLPAMLPGDGTTLDLEVQFCPINANPENQELVVTSSNADPLTLRIPFTGTGREVLVCDFDGPTTGTVGESLTFDASSAQGMIDAYDWDFGDGNDGNGAIVMHTYAAAGTYTVTLQVLDIDCKNKSSCSIEVTITEAPNKPPVCDAGGPYGGTTAETIIFDGSGSSDPDGTIDAYDWDFGDGNTGTGAMAMHMYGTAGTYTVTLCVTDDDGAVTCCDVMIEIMDPVAVELASFDVASHDGRVTIAWETSFEDQNLGFHVHRALDESDAFERITDQYIEGEDRASSYTFVDATGVPGERYVYRLEALDRRGDSEFFQLSAVTVARVLPRQTMLQQNRPNPFNPSTSITFELSETAWVTLQVYDARGSLVRTLANRQLEREIHTFEWDGTDSNGVSVGSGVYLSRLSVGATVLTRKMVLMK